MNGGQPDYRAQKILQLMMQSFNQIELNELYFNLGVDSEGVPKPANKQAYVEYLIRFMAYRNSQRAMVSQLKKSRPNLDWPNTYTVPTNVERQQGPQALRFEQYVKEQHINIYTKSSTRRKSVQKSPNSNNEKRKLIEEDLYEKIFKHTPKMALFLLTLFLFLLLGLGSLALIKKEAIIDSGLWFLLVLFILGALTLFYKLIFTAVFNQVRKTTSYYDLSVNGRVKVKYALRKREWGNKVTNLLCREMIRVLLEPNLNRANKKKF